MTNNPIDPATPRPNPLVGFLDLLDWHVDHLQSAHDTIQQGLNDYKTINLNKIIYGASEVNLSILSIKQLLSFLRTQVYFTDIPAFAYGITPPKQGEGRNNE